MSFPHKWSKKEYVAVFCGISIKEGCAVQKYNVGKAFNADDIHDFLRELRIRAQVRHKVAVFWDNASIHIAQANTTAPELKIKVIRNAPYRPDLNGIEFFWGRIKRFYR